MRKNASKFRQQDFINTLINSICENYSNITFKYIENGYMHLDCIVHNSFKKRLDHLLNIKYNPCPKCSKSVYAKIVGKTLSKKYKNLEKYIDFSKYILLDEYVNTTTKLTFLCKIHNKEFKAFPIRCVGCDICKKDKHYKWQKGWKKLSQEEVIEKLTLKYPNYDFSLVNYVNATTPIKVICDKHGIFSKTYASLTHKNNPQGCPKCNKQHFNRVSKLAKKVITKLNEFNIKYELEKSFDGLIDKKQLYVDIYIPDYNAVIECQGAQHFTYVDVICDTFDKFEYIKKHDKIKYNYFKKSNINLYYYTPKCNEKIIPTNYYDKIHTNIDELINIILKNK